MRFPGEYPIRRGETRRADRRTRRGLTDLAFKEGAVFTREDLKLREQRQLDLLTERLQRDLASLSLQQAQSGDSGAEESMSAGQQLLSELKSTHAVGRLVISLDDVMNRSRAALRRDLIVRGGDASTSRARPRK